MALDSDAIEPPPAIGVPAAPVRHVPGSRAFVDNADDTQTPPMLVAEASSSAEPANERETRDSIFKLPWRHAQKFMAALQRLVGSGVDDRAPATLVSLIVHVILLLLLAFWATRGKSGPAEGFDFRIAGSKDMDAAAELVMQHDSGGPNVPPAPTPAVDVEPPPRMATLENSVELSELLEVDRRNGDVQAAQNKMQQLFGAAGLGDAATLSASGIDDRDPSRRQQVALARGGTLESEQAVEAALDWLAAHQTPSGAWSLVHDGGVCNGRCRDNGGNDRFDVAATGLSLLAFLGAGYTHRDGKHHETVRKGVYFLLQIMEETREGGSFLYQSERGMYNHGIAAFALSEAYQMTLDPDLKKASQEAIRFISAAQSYNGGWGYLPKQPGDLTISGWQVMALKSAASAKLDVPPSTIIGIDEFLDAQRIENNYSYKYRDDPTVSPTCTAIAMLLRMFRGMSHTDPQIADAMTYLQKLGPSADDVYFNYYASLALFHVGGRTWQQWHPRVREFLLQTQSSQGHEAGSWYFDNSYGQEGGRLYTTAMAAMTLEVYYRYAPLYQNSDMPFEL